MFCVHKFNHIAMTLQIELRCIQFPLIILEMSHQLGWSPPVANSIDWTWFIKKHTFLYKVPQLTVHVRAETLPWGPWNCPQNSKIELWGGIDLWKGKKQFLECWKFPRVQWAPSLGNGKNMELTRLFLKLAVQPNWARRTLVREVTNNPMTTLTKL